MQGVTTKLSELIDRVATLSRGRLAMTVTGDDTVNVSRFMPPEAAGCGDIAFLTDPAYREAMKASRASVRVMRESDAQALFGETPLPEGTLIVCSDPYAFFAFAAQILYPAPATKVGVDARAFVEEGAQIDPTASVEAFATVKAGTVVGPRVIIKSGAYIAENVEIGEGSVIFPNVFVGHRTVIGKRCILKSGASVGGDGFGFAPFKGEWVKIPQVGRVVLGDDVEVGANTTIDRGALEDTVVGEGTKLDNQIQVAHNDRVGRHCVMAACVGIAGSTEVGDHVMIGGAAMINGHISIPSGSVIGPGTVISQWGTEPCQKTGFFPAMQGREFQRTAAMVARLPELRKDVKALARQIAAIEKVMHLPEE